MDNCDELSLAFYHYLCNVIGTEDVVTMRRRIFTTKDNVTSCGPIKMIISGSKAEGVDLDSSDFDIVCLWNYSPVYENDNAVRHQLGILPFVMDTTDCKPGYTQIRQYQSLFNHECCEYKAGHWYLSSKKFRTDTLYLNKVLSHKFMFHGPCMSDLEGKFDFAQGLRCQDWISQAQSWIIRSNRSWASDDVINAILAFGVLFVPVGCKTSQNIDLEWRISFSYAEKLLIWSLNHVQFLCYVLLKILLKELIKPITGDLLCSYFLKTIMLWICEETDTSLWKEKNILSCFMSCLDRLIHSVKYKTCVHYFIPENDMFAGRFNEQEHKLLLSTLIELQSSGWVCLLQTQTLGSFRQYSIPAISPLIHTTSYLLSLDFLDHYSSQNIEQQLKQNVYYCLRSKRKDIYMYMLSLVNRYLSQLLEKKDTLLRGTCGNKNIYKMDRRRLSHLLIGLNQDSVAGWLLLATHFYTRKQFPICKYIVSTCLFRCTPEKILLSLNPSNQEQTRFEYLKNILGINPLRLIRTYIINNVRLPHLSDILPEELWELDIGVPLFYPPVVYASLLTFLCEHHLGNQTEKNECIEILDNVIRKKFLICDFPPLYLENAYDISKIAHFIHGDIH